MSTSTITTFTGHSHPEAELRVQPDAQTTALVPAGKKQFDESLREQVRRLRDDSGGQWSNSSIGKRLGRSEAVVSAYITGTYNGDIRDVERRLRQFLRELRMVRETGVQTVDTEFSGIVADFLEEVQSSGGFGVLVAEPGVGKSRGLEHFLADHPTTVAFTAWEGECTRAAAEDLLFRAANVMHKDGARGRAVQLLDRMANSQRLVVVDDAHYLTQQALALLCGFREKTGMPLALLGTPKLLERLARDEQRWSRVTLREAVSFESLRKVNALLEHHLDSIAPDAGEDRAELFRLCREMVGKKGHFRAVCLTLLLAARLRRGDSNLGWPTAVRRAHARLLREEALN
jgi:DNA transposition AAA+ family ATPase